MFKILVFLISFISLLDLTVAQLVQDGQCNPNIQLVSNFNVTNFLGTWYVRRRFPNPVQNGDCSTLEFVDENGNLTVYSRAVQNNFPNEIRGSVTLQNGTAKFSIKINDFIEPLDFWILPSAIYGTNSLGYSCRDINATSRNVYIWELSRTLNIGDIVEGNLNQTLVSLLGITLESIPPIDHSPTACYIIPDIPAGQPIILPGQCNQNINVVQQFNASAFSGVWHEMATYASPNEIGTCRRAQYQLSGSVVEVINSEVVNQSLRIISGNAIINSTDGSAKLQVTLEVGGHLIRRPLFVLDTDYSGYAVSYTCEDLINNQRRVNSWILSRSKQLTKAAEVAINKVIRSEIDLNERFYVKTVQTDDGCFYYPEFVPNQPVIFPGQCDPNIKGIGNFSVSKYLNLWHNIESYPTTSQRGNCLNARYTLKGDIVEVYNTQVFNQTLDSITGTAVINSTDGTATLLVTFPSISDSINTANYLVLDTDYNSYALVYSCSNINDDERRVTGFKLSRTKQLNETSLVAIEKAMSQIPVLDKRYFVKQNQSEEACFFHPTPQPGLPVVFPGKCDININTVQNFSLEQFEGVWHEIASYPITQQQKNCVNHNFSPSSNTTFSVVTSSINDQFLEVFSSNGSADGNARLSIIVDNNKETIPFWILDTDYSNYALAYGCVDMPDDFRLIYSWKLSRNKQLSESNRTAINNHMSKIIVLQDRYYEEVKQSNEACFYLPHIPAGDPIILDGQCNPNISVVSNFNATAYLGNWRLIESYPSEFQTGTCNRANYALGQNNTVVVTNSQVNNQTLNTALGTATILSNGKLLVNFPGSNRTLEYWILDTDYSSYSLVYSCENIGSSRRRIWSWKLSRSRDLSPIAIDKINIIINNIDVLNKRYFEDMNQSDDGCFYYPTPDPTRPVIFPGQCDPNIKVVTNFNVTMYMDLWHDVASYPTPFQSGTCNNAFYTLRNGSVDVFNTQVINQRLDTINGIARLAGTDGSAKILVNFPKPGGGFTESPYWVLGTDYSSYALVYSCTNLDDERRQVYAWTLSRTKQLTANATQAIDRITNTVPVLDKRYYIIRNQSAESCFYYPEPKPGVEVEFPGQCANVQAVSNFNMSLFQGVWHEIQAYPKKQQTGQCIHHDYTFVSLNSTHTLHLTSKNVKAQELRSTSSVVSFASAQDTNGNLIITLYTGGQEIKIPFVVLSTDYSSYALAYSCVNLPNDFRRVFSWKLSRNKFLTPAANTAINKTMEAIDVLNNRYYENIKQTDDACFFLPPHVPGVPVEFVGQCDNSIKVVQNFRAADYLGNWHLIESYPSRFQTGTCSKANYALGQNNTVLVTNSHVTNQTLNTALGTATILSNGKLLVNFPESNRTLEYWILDTDYSSYSLVYSCENIGSSRRRIWSWKLSRSRDLSPIAIEKINIIINNIDVLNKRYFEDMNQSDDGCFYYPTPDPTRPVIFPGQCDPNIKVVTNFNVTMYMDLWHDIASYPTPFQSGTCNNAFYTLRNGSVDVFNTQVINQRLDTINGIARLAGTDGSAKILVNFPKPGGGFTESPYWVLGTDYSSYALVYSCTNLDDERRQVYAWTLSRTKQLTANATQAIDRITNTVPVLDKRYYIIRNQSAESCFYYPEPKPGVEVEFPGQCANVQAVSNFNMSLFQGVWHEIQAYPKKQQTGQCIHHDYTFVSLNSTHTLHLTSRNVKAQELRSTSSVVSFASAQDTSGNLIITLYTGGQEIKIPFVVLSTDYSSYALAYSCVNLPNDFRRVFSWKLSRNKFLTPAANTAINKTMEAIDILDNRYYENIKQTDDACFFLPPHVPGVPVEFVGQCDNSIKVVQNFRAADYLGNWHLIESYPSRFQTGTCSKANYALGQNNTVLVTNSHVTNQTLNTALGTATILSNGKLLVNFPESNRSLEYWILDTDYSSYSLVYSCENIGSSRRRIWSWKLSRSRDLSPIAIEKINIIINNIDVLNKRYFEDMNQSDDGCFYYPTPDPTRPVIFPGQCDPNIKVVTNFNVTMYMDLWHDVASYPTPFQSGTCNNAFYTLRNGSVDVFNTQVINQRLDTINGIARLAGTDGSAKILVNFPKPGGGFTESPYWVLGTDYSSYALVYSCTNLDDERRQVYAWTLSRTKQLTANATQAIDRITNTVPVLDKRYYIIRNQSAESCFYYPEPKPGVEVEFPGQCANVQAVSNFNMSLFQGVWHEIQAYPKKQQTGQCIHHDYTFVSLNSTHTLHLTSKNVKAQELRSTSSVVSFASAQDTSGNLIITLHSGGQEIKIPFVVLSTDYSSYALAYSCVNLPNDFRRVFSWKLSRNKFLTPAANTAINKTMEAIDVLDNRYYENIKQTDDACFFLPPHVPGVPVEFVGQCDNSIKVVQNFRAADYMGRWLLIDSYPATRQNGTCNSATYTLNSNGNTVNVYNTKVFNQELITINGTAVFATNDSSAKLLVTFPESQNTAPYWVLDTDYISFALVYSCQNLPNNRRRVYSWKLSRSSELSPTAVARIGQVMSQVNVLENRYFESVNRNDSSCFYFPTPGKDSVEFLGRCEENIPVVKSFNATAYRGTWYDIESYPTGFQFGSCPTANYEISNNVLNVYNTEIVAQRLSSIRGSAVLVTSDGSAKLNVSFPISGSNATTNSPYWVLATDYINYALVYSCVNLETNYRRVKSWKLSRSKSLTTASTNKINQIISSIQVLDQRYYLKRGHSDENCFYYPENNGGPVIQNGQCQTNINIVNNFDIDAFAGAWYEIARFPSELQNGECVSNDFVVNNQIYKLSKTIIYNERSTTVVGNATLPENRRGIINVDLSNGAGATFSTTYQVLDVVYNDFALLHNCRNLNGTHKQIYSWKLSRHQTGLSQAAVARINAVVSNTTELFEDYYDTTDQTSRGCFHYPVFNQLPNSIELIGLCDTTIRAKPNFNVTAYLGKWYDIESYPQAFQNGECARAQYSAGFNVVNVLNTQVVNRTLDARTATAVLASNDSSGILEVTFPFGNARNVVNYYVLETDYTSFSLVYSCQNLPNARRRVSSWKLSRGKVLPSNAAPVIDNIINSTQGLIQEYYRPISQSDEDCFYIPEVNKNEAPLFRGQCEITTGMQGFNAQKYLGWWHEIESYPTGNDIGDCVSSTFTSVGNQYQVVDINVFNNSAQVNTSVVTISADGRIRKVLSNGVVADIWVLETDYETYSLLYSCETVTSDYKRVWSAKHSKSRQLTAAAQQAMASIINRTETLESQFYIPVNQSDEACFHYPEQDGMQIILPGQCDPNIPVLQNFEPANYTGTWYQIEKYPQRYENGTCIGARYTLDVNTGVVDVLNWQVLNGTLDTIKGTATVNSTDGSAKLIVNLPIRNSNRNLIKSNEDTKPDMVSMELYILKTDYITYSLVYSCVDINPFQRSVGVWKLSRTRTMLENGDSEINSFMRTRQELHQPYFETVEQNNECEEPNSSYLVKSSIIIILICSLLHVLY